MQKLTICRVDMYERGKMFRFLEWIEAYLYLGTYLGLLHVLLKALKLCTYCLPPKYIAYLT